MPHVDACMHAAVCGAVQRCGAAVWCSGVVQRCGAAVWCSGVVQLCGAAVCCSERCGVAVWSYTMWLCVVVVWYGVLVQ